MRAFVIKPTAGLPGLLGFTMRFFDRSRHVFRYRSNIFHVSCLSSFPKNNLNNVTIIPILPVVSNQTCDGCSSLTVNSVLRSKNQYLPVKIATASSSHNQIRQFTTGTINLFTLNQYVLLDSTLNFSYW
jgi:hypothetical protein